MRWKGWLRLWIVVSAIGVPVGSIFLGLPTIKEWNAIDARTYQMCYEQEENLSSHPSSTACIHSLGADKSVFEREHTTALAFWSEALLAAFVFDLILTALLIGAIAVIRWIVRGFRSAT